MRRLTEAQMRALKAMPFDYMEWGLDLLGPLPEAVRSRSTLHALEERGLAKCLSGAMSRQWIITEAGRAALKMEGSDG